MRFSRVFHADARRVGLGVFAVALLVRVAYLLDIRNNPFFRTPVIDAEFYHTVAASLAQGVGLGLAPYQMPPLYPLLLSVLYRLVGPNLLAAHVLQILIGAGCAALAWAVGRRAGGPVVGLVAAALVATSKTLLYLEGDVLATPLSVLLDLAALLFLLRFLQDGSSRRDLLLAGLMFGLSALALPLILVAVPPVVIWLAWSRRQRAAAIWLLLATLLPIVPVTVRNWRASGELVFISANGGINFYMGNNPDLMHTAELRPGPEWRRMQEMPLRAAGITSSAGRERWFTLEGLRFWGRQPGRALAQTFEKAVLLVHNHERMRDFDFYYFRAHFSRLLRAPWWNFAMLLSLALVGLVLAGSPPGGRAAASSGAGGPSGTWLGTMAASGAARAEFLGITVLRLFLVAYATGIVLFFVTARYRAPLVPILAVFAGRGAVWVAARARAGSRRELAVAAGVAVVVLLGSWIDWYGVDRVDEVEARYRVASTIEKRGHPDIAMKEYDAVLKMAPDHELAAARAAGCAQRLGHPQEAVDRYEALLDKHPDYVEVIVNLATLAWRNGDPEAADNYFKLAISTDPYLAQAHGYYGLFLLERGDARSALEPFQEAIRLDTTWEQLRLDYARALIAAGDVPAAWQEIEHAAAVMRTSDKIELVRGDALQATGKAAEARAAWERGLRLDPSNATLRERLQTGGRSPGIGPGPIPGPPGGPPSTTPGGIAPDTLPLPN